MDEEVVKPRSEWSESEKKKAQYDLVAKNIIISSLTDPACKSKTLELCLVKLGSTYAPCLPPSSAVIHLKNLQKTKRRRCGRSHSNAQVSD